MGPLEGWNYSLIDGLHRNALAGDLDALEDLIAIARMRLSKEHRTGEALQIIRACGAILRDPRAA